MKKLVWTLSRKNLETELPEGQSTVNQFTHQMMELQEVINSFSESQDFKDLETASSSGSADAPAKPLFSEFVKSAVPRQFDKRNLCSLPGDVFGDSRYQAFHLSHQQRKQRAQKRQPEFSHSEPCGSWSR